MRINPRSARSLGELPCRPSRSQQQTGGDTYAILRFLWGREQMPDDIVQFLRKRDYKLIKELGEGACGKTVLLKDEELGELYVAKNISRTRKPSHGVV